MNVDIPEEVSPVYQQFLSSGFDSAALATQATQEMEDRLDAEYGFHDYASVVALWQSNPLSVPVDGRWGFSHAASSLGELEVMRLSGSFTTAQIVERANEMIARWYVREYVSRCDANDPVGTMNPLAWDKPAPDFEDSRADYYTARLFIEWYLQQI